jgi:hypothetical protein
MTTRAAVTAEIAKMTTAINAAGKEQSKYADGSDLWRAYNSARNTLENLRDGQRRILADLED